MLRLHYRCGFLMLLLLALLSNACDLQLPTNPPDYIKDVVAYKEGSDGVAVYFVLADKNGAETTASGNVSLRLTLGNRTLYEKKETISSSQFFKAKITNVFSEEKRIIYYFGRITYDQFINQPSGFIPSGKAVIEFKTQDGRILKGNTFIYY